MLIHNSLNNVIKDKSLDYWMIIAYYDEYAAGMSMLIEYVSLHVTCSNNDSENKRTKLAQERDQND